MGVSCNRQQCRKVVETKPLVAKSRVGRFAQRCILRVEEAVQSVASRVSALLTVGSPHNFNVLERRLVQEIRAHERTIIKVEPPRVVVVLNYPPDLPSCGVAGHIVKGQQKKHAWGTTGHRLGDGTTDITT